MKMSYRIVQIIAISVLMVLIYDNIHSVAIAQNDIVDRIYPSVYVAPLEDDLFVNPSIIQNQQLSIAKSSQDLEARVNNQKNIAIIYIHPNRFKDIDKSWLRKQFARGITIVAINTPISSLSQLVGKDIPVKDLPIRKDLIEVSFIYPVFDEASQDIIGWGWYSDYSVSFDATPQAVNRLLQGNHKK